MATRLGLGAPSIASTSAPVATELLKKYIVPNGIHHFGTLNNRRNVVAFARGSKLHKLLKSLSTSI